MPSSKYPKKVFLGTILCPRLRFYGCLLVHFFQLFYVVLVTVKSFYLPMLHNAGLVGSLNIFVGYLFKDTLQKKDAIKSMNSENSSGTKQSDQVGGSR